jgi:pimeloyl-ACP methyl ester carboxylesterase
VELVVLVTQQPKPSTRRASFGRWRVAYEARGDPGVAVILVHGWASDRSFWRPLLEALWPGVRLVAVDLIGHGESDAPQAAYTMDFLARSVIAVLDAESVDRAILVGHSAGVSVARQLYRHAPERVAALALIDGYLREVPWTAWQEEMLVRLKGPGYREVIEQWIAQMPPSRATEGDLALVAGAMRGTPQHVAVGTLEASRDPAIWRADPIERPVLLVRANTPFAPVTAEQLRDELRPLAPAAELHVWEDATHILTMEHPERFNGLLQAFVERVIARPIRRGAERAPDVESSVQRSASGNESGRQAC